MKEVWKICNRIERILDDFDTYELAVKVRKICNRIESIEYLQPMLVNSMLGKICNRIESHT